MMTQVDVNSDMGERDDPKRLALDAEMMPFITSVNIACGAHAGSPDLMRRTSQLAARHGVAIGAHPGLPDRERFGRVEQSLPPQAITALVVEQIQTLARLISQDRLKLTHVKPHGALYNMAANDRAVALAIVRAVQAADPTLRLYALAGSVVITVAQEAGLTVVNEAFADRAYRPDGCLLPRSEKGAVLESTEAVRRQLRQLIAGSVISIDGRSVPIQADSICLHSDTAQAVPLARMIRQELASAGISVTAPRHNHA
jgi:UPF0271 protein